MIIRRRTRAFTLLEIIVAMGIIVIVLLALFSLLAGSQRLRRVSAEHAQANVLVNAKLAELRAFLRAEPNDEKGQRFVDLQQSIGALNSATGVAGAQLAPDVPDLLVGESTQVLIELGRKPSGQPLGVQARMWVSAITVESRAQTELGLTGIDLDMDGVTGESDVNPTPTGDLGNMHYLPVKVTIRWTPGDDAAAVAEVTGTALLY